MATSTDSSASDSVTSALAPLDQLASYAQQAPGYVEDVKKGLDEAGLGDTDAGKALAAGAKGALAGVGAGAGVAATVATTAVATGVLATGAVALQAIPIAGTIAGAVLGIIAGLTAFFTGKAAKVRNDYVKAANEALDYMNRYMAAVALLPAQDLRDAAGKLGEDAQITAGNEWLKGHGISGSLSDASITEAERVKRIERFKDPKYWNRVEELYKTLPDQVKTLTIKWVAQQQAPKSFLTPRRVGYAILALGLVGGLYYVMEKRR